MRVEHPRGFVTQYKYRDHSFEETLKPAPAEQKLKETENKEAFVRSNGTVVVREKSARAATRDSQQTGQSAASRTGPVAHAGLRKVQSANFDSGANGRTAQRRELLAARLTSGPAPWKPSDAVPRCLEKDLYVPVIHPKPYLPAPHRVLPPALLNQPKTDFAKFVPRTNRELFVLTKTHLPERPPRYFFDHRKPEFDFFKNVREQASEPVLEVPAPATKPRPATMGLRTKSELRLIATAKDSTTAVPTANHFPPRVRLDPLASH